jgi:hypothetical protein
MRNVYYITREDISCSLILYNRVVKKKYDGLIRLESTYHIQFLVKFSHFCINLYCSMSKLAKIWNVGYLAVSCSIRTIRFLEITPNLIN